MRRETGKKSGISPKKDESLKSPQMFVYKITELYGSSPVTTLSALQWNDNVMSSLVQLALESRAELGMKQGWTLILKILGPSFGTDTQVASILSSMNFEAVLTSPISCDGLTGILYEWRSKEPLVPCSPPRSGSPPISQSSTGTLESIQRPWTPLKEDFK